MYSAGVGGQIAANLAKVMDAVKKILQLIKGAKSPLRMFSFVCIALQPMNKRALFLTLCSLLLPYVCSAAVGGQIAANLAKVMDAVKKIFQLIKGAKGPLRITQGFVTKGVKVVKNINDSGIVRGLVFTPLVLGIKQAMCSVPILLALACLFFVVFERKAQVSRILW